MLIVMLVNILVTCVFPHSPLLFCITHCVQVSTENTIHNTREPQAYNIHCHRAAQYGKTIQ